MQSAMKACKTCLDIHQFTTCDAHIQVLFHLLRFNCRMDSAWAKYSMARLRLGLDVGVDPEGIAQAVEMHDQAVYAKVAPLVVKLNGFSQNGSPAGLFSGFLHGDVIVAAGHMQGFSGNPTGSTPPAVAFRVRYPTDGFEEDVQVVAAPPPGCFPDLMLLKGSRSGVRLGVTTMADMASVYAFGYTGAEDQPSCSKGIVASTKPGAVAITAHADNGFSGGPVVDKHSRLLGVVKGSLGTTVLRVGITSNYDLHTYLLQSGYPGLI